MKRASRNQDCYEILAKPEWMHPLFCYKQLNGGKVVYFAIEIQILIKEMIMSPLNIRVSSNDSTASMHKELIFCKSKASV